MIPFDLPPKLKLWVPAKPAIIRAASMDELTKAMPLMGMLGGAAVGGLRPKGGVPAADGVERSPSNMTTNSAPSPFVVASSGDYSGYTAFRAFDGGANEWLSAVAPPVWLSIDLSTAYWIASYDIKGRALNNDHDPTAWSFQGSTDNSNWTTVDSQSGITWSGTSVTKSYTIASGSRMSARYWRFYCTAATSFCAIQEMNLYT